MLPLHLMIWLEASFPADVGNLRRRHSSLLSFVIEQSLLSYGSARELKWIYSLNNTLTPQQNDVCWYLKSDTSYVITTTAAAATTATTATTAIFGVLAS